MPRYNNRKVLLVSWNCENQRPTGVDLQRIVDLAKKHNPDLIALALQEAKGISKVVAEFGGKLPNYTKANDGQKMGGVTKPKDGWTNTAVAAFVKTDQKKFVDCEDLTDQPGYHIPDWDKAKSKSKQAAGSIFRATKGGAVLVLNYQGLRISFISCHLDASSMDGRAGQIRSILKTADKHQVFSANIQPDAIFVMGDLNYRVNSIGQGYTYEDISRWFVDPVHREALYAHDSFLVARGTDFPGFTFPKPMRNGEVIFPTYKRTYKIKGPQNSCVLMHQAYNEGNPVMAQIMAHWCYFGDGTKQAVQVTKRKFKIGKKVTKTKDKKVVVGMKDPVVASKRNQLEFGWLDRIGWKTGPMVQVYDSEFSDIPETTLADHTPVYMIANMVYTSDD